MVGEAICAEHEGEWHGEGTSCASIDCDGGDGEVGVGDILDVLAQWGPCI